MNNVITVFMNYKISRLIEYGVLVYSKDSSFIRNVFSTYFQTYIDNYYYGIFNTVDEERYNQKNLKLEFSGVMEEMLYDYQEYESKVSHETYEENQRIIRELRDIAHEVIKLDGFRFSNKEEVDEEITNFISQNALLSNALQGKIDKMIRLVRDTYVTETRLIQYESQFFTFEEKTFIDHSDIVWLELAPNIKTLEVYRKGLVEKANQDERLVLDKMECLIQKVSHMILMNVLNKKENKKYFIPLHESLVSRGTIDSRILSLIDNPLFQKYVVLSVPYNTYLNQKNAFAIDNHFAAIQDFSHINDIYQKIDSIYNEGFSHYLIISDCRVDDRDYFMNYKNEVMSVLMFEEEQYGYLYQIFI